MENYTKRMEKLLEKIDAKTITSAGGILLSAFFGWILYLVITDQNRAIVGSIQDHSNSSLEAKKELNEILRNQVKVMEMNTSAVRELQLLLRQIR